MIKIRKGGKSDLKEVIKLIRELAEYENAIDKVKINLYDLEKDGFSENPLFSFIVAEIQHQIIGMAFYYTTYSTWDGKCLFLEDLVVTKKYRSQGVGSSLFKAMIEIAKKNQSNRMMWQILNWNTPAIEFYKNFNAQISNEWLNGKLNKDQIENFKF
ncbi:GNAT family N-acetyltransferase [Flavobacteriales bacterium]|nr:GNAT family N-acetyltransferase [Flavobacteriales bacterium]